MDGIIQIKPETKIQDHLEPKSYSTLLKFPLKHKFMSALALLSLLAWTFPHSVLASEVPRQPLTGPMVFVVGSRLVYIDNLNLQLNKLYTHEQMRQELDRQIELADKLKQYLQAQGSPLANYTSTLIQLSNWKKIISLSAAESGMCKHYPVSKANCWGIGGANLWYLGSNLNEGILSMNHFLDAYPLNSSVKYSQMTFKQMNGLYKQPKAQHWVDNNQAIYNDLTAIENSL